MEVYIESVTTGAEYEDGIFNYWMRVHLKKGQQINVFDAKGYNLSEFVNQRIECLILAYLIRLIESDEDIEKYERLKVNPSTTKIISGAYIKEYKIPSKWKRVSSDLLPALQTSNGVFMLTKFDLYNYNFKQGQEITIHVQRFDLMDWHSIKQPNPI